MIERPKTATKPALEKWGRGSAKRCQMSHFGAQCPTFHFHFRAGGMARWVWIVL